MPTFTLTLQFRSNIGADSQESVSQKGYWEGVVQQLQEKGAHIRNIQSTVGKVGEPPAIVNKVTITYDAPAPVRYEAEQPPREG